MDNRCEICGGALGTGYNCLSCGHNQQPQFQIIYPPYIIEVPITTVSGTKYQAPSEQTGGYK